MVLIAMLVCKRNSKWNWQTLLFSESYIHQSKKGWRLKMIWEGGVKKDGGYDWEPWKCFDTSSLYTVTEKWDFVASYVSREKIIHFLHGDYLLRLPLLQCTSVATAAQLLSSRRVTPFIQLAPRITTCLPKLLSKLSSTTTKQQQNTQNFSTGCQLKNI